MTPDDPQAAIPQSVDARFWAQAFVQTLADLKQHIQTADGPMPPSDVESWMLSWFANAIMRGWDEHARRYPQGEAKAAVSTTPAEPATERRFISCPACGYTHPHHVASCRVLTFLKLTARADALDAALGGVPTAEERRP